MAKHIKSIHDPKISLNILTLEEVRKIHTATLDIIESTGVRFPSHQALDILEAHGAQVNRETMVAKIPGHLVEEYLGEAPPTYTLAALDPELDLPMDGNHSFLGTDGCGVEIIDAFTGERRRSTKQDVSDVARVADYLEEIAFHWVPIAAQDYPAYSRGLHELEAIWQVSQKHLQTESIYSKEEMETAIEMCTLLAGGREALRKRPIFSVMQCTAGPLGHDGGSLEAGLLAAEAGLPVGYMTMAACLTTGPATLAGNLVVGNAEVISALALMEMAYPGCPVYYAAAQTSSDLRTGGYTGGGPEDFLFGAATNLLADFYKVPLSMGAYATGAKEPNWQSAVDNSLSSFMAVSTLADMLLGAGLLHGSRIFSYEMLLMDCEIWDIHHAMFKGIVVDEENLALDVIRAVGPGGNFLTQRHTKLHMRERWVPTLMDRRPYNVWEEKRDGPRQWALERAQHILNEHHPNPLDPRLAAELSRLIAKHEERALASEK
ncbi:MAG: trimethylamine methyltransferase family protein [Anaerolineales bacterium]|nr:trimethylamine methyltransferase family protein [Anaerolineales bacterium]